MARRQVGALLLLNEWNIRYATSTWTAYWTAHSSGLRYALLPATMDSAIASPRACTPTRYSGAG
jgi:hypothetical protein